MRAFTVFRFVKLASKLGSWGVTVLLLSLGVSGNFGAGTRGSRICSKFNTRRRLVDLMKCFDSFRPEGSILSSLCSVSHLAKGFSS